MIYKSRRSKACDISPEVRDIVWHRDHGRCVVCGRVGLSNAHYIRRSQGGLGIEQNIVTLCTNCHEEFDNGNGRERIGNIVRDYLSSKYPDWDESKLKYDKWSFLRIKH